VDFGKVAEIYTDTSSSSCSIEALADEGVKGGTGCSSRTGCMMCVAISKDKSAENVVANTGNRTVELLLNIRNAIKAAQFDLSKRTWLFKTITSEGKIKLEPGSLSPEFIKNLYRWWLTVQAETGYAILREDEVLWVAANWNRYGIGSSNECIAIWHQVMKMGERFYPASEDLIPAPQVQIPRGEYIMVVDDQYGQRKHGWFDDRADLCSQIANVENGHTPELFPEVVRQLEGFAYSNTDAVRIALKGKRSLDSLDLTEQSSYLWALEQAKAVVEAASKGVVDNLLPKSNGIDQMDAAFFLHQFSGEFYQIFLKNPNMSPGDSHKVLSTQYGINMFNAAGMVETERMLQRANLIHRLGMQPYLNDPEKLLAILEWEMMGRAA
jgi:hypothetical protein